MRYEYVPQVNPQPTLEQLAQERREAAERVKAKRAIRRALMAAGITGVVVR